MSGYFQDGWVWVDAMTPISGGHFWDGWVWMDVMPPISGHFWP